MQVVGSLLTGHSISPCEQSRNLLLGQSAVLDSLFELFVQLDKVEMEGVPNLCGVSYRSVMVNKSMPSQDDATTGIVQLLIDVSSLD